jgi:transposase
MPAQYVKASLKRNKNNAADAAAICEAVVRSTMRFVAAKTAEQQAGLLLHRGRERLVRQRTGLVNALRGHLAEFGVIAPLGLRNVGKLIAVVRDAGDRRVPDLARQVLKVLAPQIEQLEAAVTSREAAHGLAQEQPRQPASGDYPGHRADHRHGDCSERGRTEWVPQWP